MLATKNSYGRHVTSQLINRLLVPFGSSGSILCDVTSGSVKILSGPGRLVPEG